MQQEITKALEILKSGGTILYPTDTIWGIGCDATNEEAVKKVFDIKGRTQSKSLIILIDNEAKLNRYLKDIPALAYDLIDFTEKPLTIVYSDAKNLAKNVINEDGTIGIRIIKDEFCKKLIEKFGKPIVSTSANISGEPSPASFKEINPIILSQVDYIVNLRQHETSKNQASSIIKLSMDGQVKVIRK
jgi:L-threonylcarbamoyladenylate synthase